METYGSDVWNYAYVLCGSREEADDISQEVFLKAYQKSGDFRGEASVKTWLLTITRNMTYSWRRKLMRRASLQPQVRDTALIYPSAEAEAMERHYSDSIWAIIMKLPAPYRETLVLDIKYGLPVQDIAALLHVAPGTVKSRLSRARDKVRAQLQKEEQQ
ncbi:hypothetical protein B9T62_13755 [Paenibacillus donghaensis]|uniref:RNA polymerase subunit sigma-70 n=2 Tax=Paenibacillus donghaensis TaxID=414771 RepID=A0A2Z2KP66_9BACL|nr:hypothetical protein B9T62_13755 [Paenibacillus donghaensis]